jgi:hypothetical protein
VIQFPIESFRVVPAKEQWETMLDRSRAKFREYRRYRNLAGCVRAIEGCRSLFGATFSTEFGGA